MKVPRGFRFAGVHCGIKPYRKDLALVVSDRPCAAAGIFTTNRARAAPVIDAEARLPSGGIWAIVINSGNANALTGPDGVADVEAVRMAAARELGLRAEEILTASTGVIGHRLPVHKLVKALPAAVAALKPEPEPAAEAILTTDTRIKIAARTVSLPGPDGAAREVTLAALCKGSGMVAPELATLLAVLVTDAAVDPRTLRRVLQRANGTSFAALTIDGETSTNDAVFALANGAAGCSPLEGEELDRGPLGLFADAARDLFQELAREAAADGEGATKLITVKVAGGPSDEIALDLARAVAGSTLVKAAVFGADPNWGRILASVGGRAGRMGYAIDPAAAQVRVQGVAVYDRAPCPFDPVSLKARLRAPEVLLEIALGEAGSGAATAWGCDLTYDYVKLNADYSSLLVPTESGGVAKDDRLTNYTPRFKVSLLVEALSYLRRLAGIRCVVKYSGTALAKESLQKSFCDDIVLLRSAGLRPVIVTSGGQELVTLLNQEDGHAVGLSGNDGALLRARRTASLEGTGAQSGEPDRRGELLRVNKEFLEMLVGQGYVPVISPVGLGEDGQLYDLNPDEVAGRIAAALAAQKLIFLSNVAGLLKDGELITELSAEQLRTLVADGTVHGPMRGRAQVILEALRDGVGRVHVVDGRTPHSIIGELFTEHGVGSLVTP